MINYYYFAPFIVLLSAVKMQNFHENSHFHVSW